MLEANEAQKNIDLLVVLLWIVAGILLLIEKWRGRNV